MKSIAGYILVRMKWLCILMGIGVLGCGTSHPDEQRQEAMDSFGIKSAIPDSSKHFADNSISIEEYDTVKINGYTLIFSLADSIEVESPLSYELERKRYRRNSVIPMMPQKRSSDLYMRSLPIDLLMTTAPSRYFWQMANPFG